MSSAMVMMVIIAVVVVIIAAVPHAALLAASKSKLPSDEQQGYNKFTSDWKKACPDSNNETAFCNGYLMGASIRSSGP